ncbi:MAG: DUF3276 family protein [Saprospiraceae bacterium]|nr:DUF3276 family protein [Saprospiraceae bacterium]
MEYRRKIYLCSQLLLKIHFSPNVLKVEYGYFKRRGDFRDRNDRNDNRDRGGYRDRNDRNDNRDRGFDRDRGSDRDRSSDRDRGYDRDRDRGFDRDRGYDRDRGGDRGGFRGGYDRNRGGGGGGFDRDNEESVFSKRVRAGKRRTYFFDVRKTRGEDYFITITESTRREDGYGYKRHKIFLYKEDFNRFVASLNEVVDHVKTDLMPNFDYEEFDRRQAEWEAQNRDLEDDERGNTRDEWAGREEEEDFVDEETSDETEIRDERKDEQEEESSEKGAKKRRTKKDDDEDVNW